MRCYGNREDVRHRLDFLRVHGNKVAGQQWCLNSRELSGGPQRRHDSSFSARWHSRIRCYAGRHPDGGDGRCHRTGCGGGSTATIDRYRLLGYGTARWPRGSACLDTSGRIENTHEYHVLFFLACVATVLARLCRRLGGLGTVPRYRSCGGGSRERFTGSRLQPLQAVHWSMAL